MSTMTVLLPQISSVYLTAATQSAVLPMTGGDGSTLVTVIGVSMAALSILILFLRWKSSRKQDKRNRQ